MSEKLDKIKERINEIKREKEEIGERYDYLVGQLKKETDKNAKDIEFLKNELGGMLEKSEIKDGRLSEIRTFMISLQKSIASLESRQAAMREKLDEDVKLMGRELNSQLGERARAIEATLVADSKAASDKGTKDAQLIKDGAKKVIERNAEYDKEISRLSASIATVNKSLSELTGKNDALKSQISDRIGAIEKEMGSELLKVRELESRLNKDVKDFEKFASEQRTRMKEFEAGVAGKLDMFAVKKENLKRDFESLASDFKSVAGRLDSLKDKDSYFDTRLRGAELGIESLRKTVDEKVAKVADDQKAFGQSVVERLNEASDKIVARLAHNEEKTVADIIRQADETKVFRAHMTQFINDFVNNYEKRFEKLKSDIDQALVGMERRANEQSRPRPVIVE